MGGDSYNNIMHDDENDNVLFFSTLVGKRTLHFHYQLTKLPVLSIYTVLYRRSAHFEQAPTPHSCQNVLCRVNCTRTSAHCQLLVPRLD